MGAFAIGRLGSGAAALLLLCPSPWTPTSGTTPFVLDGNRVYAQLDFVRPDGSTHRALAFVDMGSSAMSVSDSLARELRLGPDHAMRFFVGALLVTVPAAKLSTEHAVPHAVAGSPLTVEATLPAGVLRHYQVVVDYHAHTLTLAGAGELAPVGVGVPFHLSTETGLAAVDANIDGQRYSLTIDNGSAYTWIRQSTVQGWLRTHPEWELGVGAVGPANMMMTGDSAETHGILVRVPEIAVGSLTLTHVGALGAGSMSGLPAGTTLFDWYSAKNAVPVVGWIGGNVLQRYRLTIDYNSHVMYFQKVAEPDTRDLDRVGLVLRADRGRYSVASVATKHGAPMVAGVRPGDVLIRIGETPADGASWGAIFEALGGKPGEHRELVLERDGKRFSVTAKVVAF
jgi:hypothetical protein